MNLLGIARNLVPKLFRWGLISRWLIALCFWAVSMQVAYPMLLPFRVPGFINAVVIAVCLIVLAVRLAERFAPKKPLWMLVRPFLHVGDMVALGFVISGVGLYLNGVLGEGQPRTTYAEVKTVEREPFQFGPWGPIGRIMLQVQDSESGDRYLFVDSDTIARALPGEVVAMQTFRGGFGIPWVELRTLMYDVVATEKKFSEQDDVDLLILRGRIKHDLARNNLQQSLDKAPSYFNQQPDDIDLAMLIANGLFNAHRPDSAVQMLEPYIARTQNYSLYSTFAWYLLESGDSVRSLNYLKAAITLAPDKPQAYYQLGHTYKRLGHQKESQEAFTHLVQRAPEYAYLLKESAVPPRSAQLAGGRSTIDLVRQGSVLFVQKQFAQAIPFYQQAVDLEKTSPVLPKNHWRALINNLSVAYGITGNLPQTKATLDYGLSVDPLYPMFHYNLACAYAEMNVPEDALRALETAFRYRHHVSPGERIPDPRTDSSFQQFLNRPGFKTALERLTASQS